MMGLSMWSVWLGRLVLEGLARVRAWEVTERYLFREDAFPVRATHRALELWTQVVNFVFSYFHSLTVQH